MIADAGALLDSKWCGHQLPNQPWGPHVDNEQIDACWPVHLASGAQLQAVHYS